MRYPVVPAHDTATEPAPAITNTVVGAARETRAAQAVVLGVRDLRSAVPDVVWDPNYG